MTGRHYVAHVNLFSWRNVIFPFDFDRLNKPYCLIISLCLWCHPVKAELTQLSQNKMNNSSSLSLHQTSAQFCWAFPVSHNARRMHGRAGASEAPAEGLLGREKTTLEMSVSDSGRAVMSEVWSGTLYFGFLGSYLWGVVSQSHGRHDEAPSVTIISCPSSLNWWSNCDF